MAVTVIVGVQWGDEGKGKIVDMLTADVDIVARYQGGANAGHTVVVGDTQYVLHLIPSGILHDGVKCVIGNGVVVDPSALLVEVEELKEHGIDSEGILLISRHAHLIMPYHKVMDKLSEGNSKAGAKIGTTGRGIGPAYADKSTRLGLRVGDLYRPEYFRERLERALTPKNALFSSLYGERKPVELEPIFDLYMKYAEQLKPFVCDCGPVLRSALAEGKNILAEGAQGTMLDLDHGTYPFVTSSSASSGGACTGLGLPPTSIEKVIGIMKAYTTRVGEGPFPTELKDETGVGLQNAGGEFGATTGRPRRCGWLDALVGRYAVDVNGIDEIALTKLDVLDGFATIKICVAYETEDGRVDRMPECNHAFTSAVPVYEEHAGWDIPTAGIQDYDKLPDNAKKYIARVEELVGAKISIVSTGRERTSTIVR